MYSNEIEVCPACLSAHLHKRYLTSHAGFMSLPDLPHDKCLDCGTVFMNPRPVAEELNNFYNASATEEAVVDVARLSAERVLDNDRLGYFRANRIEPLKKYLTPSSKIYDVGCGVGAFIYAMALEGFKVRGTDLSQASVETGRKILRISESAIGIGDISAIPIGEDFDLVTLWTVIEHLLEPSHYLDYLQQNCLAQNGLVVLEFPTVDSIMFEFCRERFFWFMPPYHINIFSMQGIRFLLKRSNFEVIYEHCMPNNWYFFDSFARKIGVMEDDLANLKDSLPQLGFELDKLLDELSLRLGKSSTRWVLARRIS